MRWIHQPQPPAEVAGLSDAAGISPVLAELLLRAGVACAADAAGFLEPRLADVADPFLIPGMEAAATRLAAALERSEAMVVLGDYDVDGVTSTTLLVSVLRRLGASPRFVVPRRAEDGYGLSRSAIDRALEPGKPALFIALDCGTNSHEETAYLLAQGVDVLVVDHHRAKENLAAGLLVNPHATGGDDDGDGTRDLCTVGLVFKLVHALLKLLRVRQHPVAATIRLRDYLDLVALGTVADLVPLRGENRILARHGLRILQENPRPGLRALMEVAGLHSGQDIRPVDISYRLGPRINASGRLGDAAVSVELLLSEHAVFCAEVSLQLDSFNRERQDIERQITEQAERMVETHYADAPGIVLYGDDWHPGVVGIVAGRVSRKYQRPCVVLGNEGTLAKGSGRSIEGVNLVEVLGTCSTLLASWGGHPMAVGIAVTKDNLDPFRAAFAAAVHRHTGGHRAEAPLNLAVWLTPEQVGEELLMEIEALHPFGQGNAEPIFGVRGAVLRQRPEVFKGEHFRFSFENADGRRLFGVAWKMADRLPPTGTPLDLAVELRWNFFQGRKLMQLGLVDWRPAAG
jgi:single-stranded-DNA-specific exonuclease